MEYAKKVKNVEHSVFETLHIKPEQNAEFVSRGLMFFLAEVEYAKNLARIAHSMQPVLTNEGFLPLQSVFCTALSQVCCVYIKV